MRQSLLVHVNGREHEVGGREAFLPLSGYLRRLGLLGTKIVCSVGDCGSCSVLVGRPCAGRFRYHPVNACIQFMYQLDGTHVVTVEGLDQAGSLHPVQHAMIGCHGTQCGYCSPGFVMTLTGMFEGRDSHTKLGEAELRTGLTGNLCRCTGYLQILGAGQSIDPLQVPRMSELFPEKSMLARIERTRLEGVEIDALVDSRRRTVHLPVDLQAAVQCREEHPSAVVVSGATDVGVQIDSLDASDTILSLSNVPGMDEVAVENGTLVTGGSATWSQIEAITKDVVPEYSRILLRFGSPQIRRVATIGGNIASASPIADGVPFLMVMGAKVELVGRAGFRRVDINDFYLGDQRTVMMSDELIARVLTPLPSGEDRLRLYKVSKRRDVDIAAFTAGILIRCEGDRISSARVAFGGVASKVCRLSRTEAFLVGKAFEEEVFLAAGRLARDEIDPRTDVRGTAAYRRQLSERIFGRFFHDCSDVDTRRVAVA